MKRYARAPGVFTSVATALAFVVGGIVYGSAQGGGNPFVDHADTG